MRANRNLSMLIVSLMIVVVAALGIATGVQQQHQQQREKDALVSVATDQHNADLARITALEAELAHLRADNDALTQKADAATAAAQRAREEAASARASRSRPVLLRATSVSTPVSTGCGSSWRASLGADEAWIYERESGMDPTPADVNPSSGARGLGQLLDSTYADLGMVPDWDPCHEIAAARAYMRGRYGSWSNARAFWEAHSWW